MMSKRSTNHSRLNLIAGALLASALSLTACGERTADGDAGLNQPSAPETPEPDNSPSEDVIRDIEQLPGARTYVHSFGAVPRPCSELFDVLGGEVVDSRTMNVNGTEVAEVVVSIHVRALVASDDAYCFGYGPWGASEERWVQAMYRAERWDSGWRLSRPNAAGIGR